MKQISFIAAADGSIVKYTPPVALTREERYHAYCQAFASLASFFEKIGLQCNSIEHGATSISFGKDKIMFDVSLREPQRIAYVTSQPGYEYKEEATGKTPDIKTPYGVIKGQSLHEVRSVVKLLGSEIKSNLVVQVVLTDNNETQMPVYIELPANIPDPQRHIIINVINTLRLMATRNDRLAETFQAHFLANNTRGTEIDCR